VAAIVTFIALFSNVAWADFDLTLGGFARSFPLSGYAYLQGGYDQLLWGTAGDSNVLYGYARPYLELDSAGTYNAASANFEVFPFSFLGFRTGYEWNQNDTNYTNYHCANFNCEGTMYRQYVEGQLLLGYSVWFASLWLRWDKWTHKNPELGEFIDPNNGLIATADGDAEMVLRGFTGVSVDDQWAVVIGAQYYQMVKHFGIARSEIAGLRWRQDSLTVMGGLSYYQSTEEDGGPGAFLALTWTILPSLALK
jgi:hypothetical protein